MSLHLIIMLPQIADWFQTVSYRGEIKHFNIVKNPDDSEKLQEEIEEWTKLVDKNLDKK